MTHLLPRLKKYIHSHPLSSLAVAILILGTFLRLYNLPNSMMFLADQGRDALVVSRIFREGDLVFIGPVTSIGNMYLGPLYYYFMAPWLWLTYPSPVGPAYAVAVLGIITLWGMWAWGKELIGERAALLSMAFYSVAAVVLLYTRFSWNPNPAPLFAALMAWGSYRSFKNPRWWVLVALCFAVLIQLHYFALLSGGGAGLIWLYQAWQLWKKRRAGLKPIFLQLFVALVGAGILLASFTPLILFDWKHGWPNAHAFTNIFSEEKGFKGTEKQGTVSMAVIDTLWETHGRSLHVLFEHPLEKRRTLNTFLVLGLFYLVWKWSQHATKEQRQGLAVILTYLFVGILGSSTYNHTVYNHYLGFLYPLTYWMWGIGADQLLRSKVGKAALAVFTLYFLYLNITAWPFRNIDLNIYTVQATSAKILEQIEKGEKYGIIQISQPPDTVGYAYRYFLSATDNPPLPPEYVGQATALVVVNEPHLPNPIITSIYEFNVFGVSKVDKIYRDGQNPELWVLRKDQ
jgi:hypothetical protein